MAESVEGGKSVPGQPPKPAPASPVYRVIDLDPKACVYVPMTGRTYTVGEMDQDQLAQLFALGWPHVGVI